MKVEKDMAFPFEGMSPMEIMIRRVLKVEIELRMDVFNRKPSDLIDQSLALLEFLKYYPEVEHDVVEREMAILVLEKQKMASLLLTSDEAKFRETVRNYPDRSRGFCILCGRPLTLKGGQIDGMGLTCHKKVMEGVWTGWGKPSKSVPRVAICKEELKKERIDPTKRGLRRLSIDLEMSISTIRYDMAMAKVELATDEKYESLKQKTVKVLERYKPTKIPVLKPMEERKKCQ